VSSRVLSTEAWDEALATIPDGWRFSSLHADPDTDGLWVASVVKPPKPPCQCCGAAGVNWEFVIGRGMSPDSALNDLVGKMKKDDFIASWWSRSSDEIRTEIEDET
jgi:hypothetical protein